MPRPPDIIYGRNPVLEAFRAGRPVKRLLFAEGLREQQRLKELRKMAADRRITVEPADRRKLDDIAHSEAHQGVVAYVGPRKYWELEPMARAALADRPDAVLLMLDSLQDPQNLGTISRTAEPTRVGAPADAGQSELAQRRGGRLDRALRGNPPARQLGPLARRPWQVRPGLTGSRPMLVEGGLILLERLEFFRLQEDLLGRALPVP